MLLKASFDNYQASDKSVQIVDTPGVYGISSFNDEEKATRDFVLDADYIINVVSATTLKRDLFLTKQLSDLGIPSLLVINQFDEAKFNKVEIDIEKLEAELGVKVLTTVAIKRKTLEPLKMLVYEQLAKQENHFLVPELNEDLEKDASPFSEKVLSRAEAVMIAEGDEFVAGANTIKLPDDISDLERKNLYTPPPRKLMRFTSR